MNYYSNYDNDKERKEQNDKDKKPCHCETKCSYRCFKVVQQTCYYPTECFFDNEKKEEEKHHWDEKKDCDCRNEKDFEYDNKEERKDEHKDRNCDNKYKDDKDEDCRDRKENCQRRCCCRWCRF